MSNSLEDRIDALEALLKYMKSWSHDPATITPRGNNWRTPDGKFDRVAYQREYMRKRRAKQKNV